MKAKMPLVLGLFLIAAAANAEPPKHGRVLCEGDGCQSIDVPTGSIFGRAWGAVTDLGTRVEKRIEEPKVSAVKKAARNRKPTARRAASVPVSTDGPTNLPTYYAGLDRSGFEASDAVVFTPKSHDPKLKSLRSGDIVWAVVEQEITASPEVPTPVRAIAISGPYKSAYFVGQATLDHELKRVLFNFTKLRLKNSDSVYALKAAGLSPSGSIGLEGEYVSQTGKFFLAEMASATAAGYLDSTINRNQTVLGTYVQEPSLANSGKTAAVTALSKTTDRMAEAVKDAPEYTHVEGYQEIQVMIQDDPVEAGD